MGYVAECSRDSFCLLDKSGFEAFRKNIDFNRPAMYKKGACLLVYDYGGRSAFALKNGKLVWEDTLASRIANASTNKDGYMAFVLDSAEYRNSVKVFGPGGKALFDWVIADDYILGSDIAPSGKGLAINRLVTNGFSLSSNLELLDMKSEPLMKADSGEGEVFYSVSYLDNNALAVASGNEFRLYSEQGEMLLRERYESVIAMCEYPKKKAAVAVKQKNREMVLGFDLDDPKGRVVYLSERPIVNMSSDESRLFINLGSEVVVIDENGNLAANIYMDSDVKYGGAAEKTGVLVVTGDAAEVYAF